MQLLMEVKVTNEASDRLSIALRVKAALHLLRASSPSVPVSVSAVCRSADVSRANLYANYPGLVAEIRQTKATDLASERAEGNLQARLSDSIAARKVLQSKYDSLVMVCLELQAEIRKLRAANDSKVKARRKSI